MFEKAIPLIRYIPETNVVDLKSVLHEVRRSLDNETNFLQETKNAQEFYHFNHHWQQIEIPKVYPQWCTRKVIVMDYMEGENLNCLLARKTMNNFSQPDSKRNQERGRYPAGRELYEASL